MDGECLLYCNLSDLPADVIVEAGSEEKSPVGTNILISCKKAQFSFVLDYLKNETSDEGKEGIFFAKIKK